MTPIYHITNIDNLPSILASGWLWCDSERIRRNVACTQIGYNHIKERRLRRKVATAAGGMLGDYVPFYFCPRSVMLHSIWKGLVPSYASGQEPVVHLVTSAESAVLTGRYWAFTRLHAELAEADPYYEDLSDLDQLRWDIIGSNSWGGDERRKYKQAEFLVHNRFPWSAFRAIGVVNRAMAQRVSALLGTSPASPVVQIQAGWYY